MSPPGLGRSSSALAFSVVEVFGFCVFRSGASEFTVTSPRIDATLSVKFTVWVWPRPAATPAFSLRPELRRGGLHRVASGLELREGESPCLVRLQAPLLAVFLAYGGNVRAGYPGPGLVGHEPRYGAGGFSLRRKRSGNNKHRHKSRKSKFRHA